MSSCPNCFRPHRSKEQKGHNMKKVITILVACVLLSALFASAAIPASAKKDKSFSYISMTLAPELKGQDQFV